MRLSYFVSSILYLSSFCIGYSQVTPYDFGWDEALSGAQKATVLYNAHKYAVENHTNVDYSGMEEVDIEITKGFKSIPLSDYNDFSGIVINVKNDWKDIPLFVMEQESSEIVINKRFLDGHSFYGIKEMRKGEHLLIIRDKNPWVDERVGYGYPHIRKDVLLIQDGRSINSVIQRYDTPESLPECSYCTITETSKYFGNFIFNRLSGSSKRTDCIHLRNQAHVVIDKITVNTPESGLVHDSLFKVSDCADVTFQDIVVHGTYSTSKSFGYAFNVNNAWHTKFVGITAESNWGIMGNNNLSDTILSDCEVNRFDIHCYGKDVSLSDCVFDGGSHGWYCGGSSIYGKVQFDRCHFINCTPFALGDSYKTAVGVDVVFNDCVFNVTKKKNAVFGTKVLNDKLNSRPGLSQKCLPSIEINNMIINIPKGVRDVLLYDVGNVSYSGSVGYLRRIKINGLVINSQSDNQTVFFKLINTPVRTDKALIIDINGLFAPNAQINPFISSNRRNKVRLSTSSIRVIE